MLKKKKTINKNLNNFIMNEWDTNNQKAILFFSPINKIAFFFVCLFLIRQVVNNNILSFLIPPHGNINFMILNVI